MRFGPSQLNFVPSTKQHRKSTKWRNGIRKNLSGCRIASENSPVYAPTSNIEFGVVLQVPQSSVRAYPSNRIPAYTFGGLGSHTLGGLGSHH
jgi:hypothetical protein